MIQDWPSVFFDNQVLKLVGANESLDMSILNSPSHVSLHVIITSEVPHVSIESRLCKFIDFFAQWKRLNDMQAQCLAIIFDSNQSFEITLKYTWSKKFLDFSIINVKSSNLIFLHYFDPLHDHLTKVQFNPGTIIFPNKLRDVNKYPFAMFIYQDQYISVTENNSSVSVKFNDDYYFPLAKIALEIINFRIIYSAPKNKDYVLANFLASLEKHLIQGDANGSILPLPLSLTIRRAKYVYMEYDSALHVAIVPILPVTTLNVPYDIFVYFLLILTISTCLGWIIRVLKISHEWRAIDIISILFSLPVVKKPWNPPNRIIFVCLVFLAMNFSANFYSKLVSIEMIYDERSFDTIKEIDHETTCEKNSKHWKLHRESALQQGQSLPSDQLDQLLRVL